MLHCIFSGLFSENISWKIAIVQSVCDKMQNKKRSKASATIIYRMTLPVG